MKLSHSITEYEHWASAKTKLFLLPNRVTTPNKSMGVPVQQISSLFYTRMYTPIYRMCIMPPDRSGEKKGDVAVNSSSRMSFSQSSSAMKLGSSPWQRYSSQWDAEPQPLRRRRMSSVKVEPDAPMKTFDSAQIVLSSMASTCKKAEPVCRLVQQQKVQKKSGQQLWNVSVTWLSPPMWFLYNKASHFSELWCSGLFTRGTCLSLNTTKDCRRLVSLSAASVDRYMTGALAFSTIRRMHSAAWGIGKKQLSFFTLLQEDENISVNASLFKKKHSQLVAYITQNNHKHIVLQGKTWAVALALVTFKLLLVHGTTAQVIYHAQSTPIHVSIRFLCSIEVTPSSFFYSYKLKNKLSSVTLFVDGTQNTCYLFVILPPGW